MFWDWGDPPCWEKFANNPVFFLSTPFMGEWFNQFQFAPQLIDKCQCLVLITGQFFPPDDRAVYKLKSSQPPPQAFRPNLFVLASKSSSSGSKKIRAKAYLATASSYTYNVDST